MTVFIRACNAPGSPLGKNFRASILNSERAGGKYHWRLQLQLFEEAAITFGWISLVCHYFEDKVIRDLLRPDLFTVVHEQFFTDTADYADIVLPATTFFEHKDLQKAYVHYYVQVSNQAIAPLGECSSNVELFRSLTVHGLRRRLFQGERR